MELLKKENVQICDSAADWREAIRIAVKPLEEHGYVETRYKEEIISNVEKMGPYIVIADNIALLGLLLQKKDAQTCFKGTVKTILGSGSVCMQCRPGGKCREGWKGHWYPEHGISEGDGRKVKGSV